MFSVACSNPQSMSDIDSDACVFGMCESVRSLAFPSVWSLFCLC